MADTTINTLVLPAGGMALEETLFCGQSFSWQRWPQGPAAGAVGLIPIANTPAGRPAAGTGRGGTRTAHGPLGQPQSHAVPTTAVFAGVAGHRAVLAHQQGDHLVLQQPGGVPFASADEAFWRHYFALNEDYAALQARFAQNAALAQCVANARGIRVLRQPFWDTLLSFIISQNNHISRITALAGRLRRQYGPLLGGAPARDEDMTVTPTAGSPRCAACTTTATPPADATPEPDNPARPENQPEPHAKTTATPEPNNPAHPGNQPEPRAETGATPEPNVPAHPGNKPDPRAKNSIAPNTNPAPSAPLPLHGFPAPAVLAAADPQALRALGMGYRAEYLIDAAQKVAASQLSEEQLASMGDAEARAALCTVRGVGPKVADCVLLFGLGRNAVAPMDVWMKRAVAQLFGGELPACAAGHAGIAQQYIFHWARQNLG